MVDVFGITTAQFETFLLVFARVTAMLFVFPIFAANQIPKLLRLAFGLLIAFVIYRTVPQVRLGASALELVPAVLAQVALGLVVGYVASLVFTGIQFAGEVLDLQIGFAVANVISPQTQEQVTILGEFQLTLASLVFLATNSHLAMLAGIAGSFHLVPLPYVQLDPSLAGSVTDFLMQSMLIVFRIAAPAAVALFLVNVMLALMARVAPQMNVFVVGFPIQIGVGLVMIAVSLPLLAVVGPTIFGDIAHHMDDVMRAMRT